MKIIVETNLVDKDENKYPRKNHRVFTLEIADDLGIEDMMEEIKIILYSMTYHPDTVKGYFDGDYNELK